MAYVGRLPAVEKVPFELWDEILKLAHNKKERPADNDISSPHLLPCVPEMEGGCDIRPEVLDRHLD